MFLCRSGLIVYQHVIQNASDVLRVDGHNILELQQPAQDYVKVMHADAALRAIGAVTWLAVVASEERVRGGGVQRSS